MMPAVSKLQIYYYIRSYYGARYTVLKLYLVYLVMSAIYHSFSGEVPRASCLSSFHVLYYHFYMILCYTTENIIVFTDMLHFFVCFMQFYIEGA
jgi:hypothetical protein